MHGGKIFEHQNDSDHCYSGCADGKITTELINGYEKRDEKVAKLETEWVRTVKDSLETKFAFLPFDFTLFDPEDPSRRLIRFGEIALGDFAADAIFYDTQKMWNTAF